MNPNQQQALEQEEAGIDEVGEDIDYDAVYGGLDVAGLNTPKSKELKDSYASVFKDVAKQGAKELLIGAGGAYGDLQEFLGLNKQDPGQKSKNQRDFQTLSKINQKGYKPTLEDISDLSSDSDIPGGFSFPSSQNLRDLNDTLGGPGEPETQPGKYAQRTAKLYGSGLSFGQINPLPAIAGGVAGQAVEDLGGGPLLQAAAEIVAMISTPAGGLKRGITSGNKEVQQKINDLRKLGYTEEDITLAINSAYKDSRTSQIASKGERTEKAFEDFAENSDKIVRDILEAEIPGIERGTKHVHEMASDFYGKISREAENIIIKDSTPFINSATNVVKELRQNLGNNPEAAPLLNRLYEAVVASTTQPSARNFMEFYKELNGLGKWMGRSQKDRLINQVKEGIKDTFKKEGKQGKEFAKKFEEANEGIRKAYKAEEVHDLIQKVTTQEGIDYKRFNKLFDKEDNVKLFTEVLGPQQTKNLDLIGKVGSQVKNFDKSWKVANPFKANPLDIITGSAATYYIYQGDWEGLAKVAATKLGTSAIRKIAEKSITDPKFQNLLIKGLHAVKVESPKLMKSANEAIIKHLEQEGIDLKDF